MPSEPVQPQERSELSDLEVALLGLLSVRPMTGYDIHSHYARALAPWWDSPRTQIYPKLRQLEKRGLTQHEYIVQEGKPNKRLYSVTNAGAEALSKWLHSDIRWPHMRHDMMMRLFLGNLLPQETTREVLTSYRERISARASSLREARERFSTSLAGPYRESVFFELLSLEHLIAMTDTEISGTDKVLAALEKADALSESNGDQASQLLDIIRELFS